jgi:hypothetical protein
MEDRNNMVIILLQDIPVILLLPKQVFINIGIVQNIVVGAKEKDVYGDY